MFGITHYIDWRLCHYDKNKWSKRSIKENFNKTLSVYPTKNLDDFYDKEGFRDQEFDKRDKGTWIIYSEMVIEPKGKNMESRGMVLYINRNTRTTKGNFIVTEITEDSKGYSRSKEKNILSRWKIIELFQQSLYRMTS
ncbi:tandem lipoprotein [Staphylococcus aureus F76996]|nr:tandem lipoprotein [Staphylococcus aureus F76996]